MYRKAEQRVGQYAMILEEKAYQEIPYTRMAPWRYATRSQGGEDRVPVQKYKPMSFPFAYGKGWTNWWFTTTLDLSGLSGEVFLKLVLQTDAMVYIDGIPQGAVNPFHELFRLTPFLGSTHTIHVEAWDGHAFPGFHPGETQRILTTVAVRQDSYPLTFSRPSLLQRDDETFALAYDVKTLLGVSRLMDKNGFAWQYLISNLHGILMRIDVFPGTGDAWRRQVSDAREGIRPLLTAKNGTFAPQILSIGNAHLDNAWLWPVSETSRKAARTCLNMVDFAHRYPSFRFLFTQPAQLLEMKRRYPSVFAKVHQAFLDGTFEPNGVTFVEPDGNLPSGESLIRQCLYGRKTTAELFDGYQGDTCWLPDSFGYSAIIPQILSHCGVTYFVTSKLSWNDTTRFPYDIFRWEGLDGSSILCSMIQGAYEGKNDPVDVAGAYQKIQDKAIQPILVRSVGEGDGGGGTMESDLEYMEREQNLQGMPKNKWTTLSEAMHTLFGQQQDLPTYKGELYLELHRGTYTGQARIKRYNREMESLLHAAEYWTAVRFSMGRTVASMLEKLDEAWKIVLLNQFHDVLPGSSIREVNKEAEATYQVARSLLRSILPHGKSTADVLNVSPFPYPLPDGTAIAPYHEGKLLSLGERVAVEGNSCVADWGTTTIDRDGRISSLVAFGRQLVLCDAPMNTLTIGEDYPIKWDAWDLERDSLAKSRWIGTPVSQRWEKDATAWYVTQTFRIGETSSLTQTITISKRYPRLDFSTAVDWHESHRILRVEFPSSLTADDALFDSSFGFIKRSVHHDYPEQQACFEMPAHMWAAMEDATICVALASDSKYGYGADKNTLSLSLLRSSKAPDPEADQGFHEFTYSYIISSDSLASVMMHASMLNMETIKTNEKIPVLCTVTRSSVIVETVKVAENRKGVILRLREPFGIPQQAEVALSPFLDGTSLIQTDFLERPVIASDLFSFRPFEVKTFFVPLAAERKTKGAGRGEKK
ncbi:MAG: glycoside hydrolase family 38 C-terminal domain-containing protein [Sphaerochaetaceae bacterium]